MLLKDRLSEDGSFLFRWRSYLPLALLPLVIVAISQSGAFDDWISKPMESAWGLGSLCVAMLGLSLRALTVGHVPEGTSGRNTRAQSARTLNTTGLYSVTRNPLYLGNLLVMLGIVLGTKVWWLIPLMTAFFALYYERIIVAEEEFLEEKFGTSYTEWARRTPIFLPEFRLWRKPALAFSIRSGLRREFPTFYLIVVAFTLVELGHDTLAESEQLAEWVRDDTAWLLFFGTGTLIYLITRLLKKHTRILEVPGR